MTKFEEIYSQYFDMEVITIVHMNGQPQLKKDGIKQDVAYIYYTDTIWTKYLSKPQNHKEYKYSINNSSWIDYGNGEGNIEIKKDISAVYYLDYSNIKKLSNKELIKNSSKAVLLWKK